MWSLKIFNAFSILTKHLSHTVAVTFVVTKLAWIFGFLLNNFINRFLLWIPATPAYNFFFLLSQELSPFRSEEALYTSLWHFQIASLTILVSGVYY